jgi:hypothetical protein
MKMRLLVSIGGFCLENGSRSVRLDKGDIITIKFATRKTVNVTKEDVGYTLSINHLLLMERVNKPTALCWPLDDKDMLTK